MVLCETFLMSRVQTGLCSNTQARINTGTLGRVPSDVIRQGMTRHERIHSTTASLSKTRNQDRKKAMADSVARHLGKQ